MLKKLKYLIAIIALSGIISFSAVASDIGVFLDNVSQKIAESVEQVIPGEGITEVSVEVKEAEKPEWSMLGVRDINKGASSNTFTQFSLSTDVVNDDKTYLGNIGFGHRKLFFDDSLMVGGNGFFDFDLTSGHQRASLGLEARASALELNTNYYLPITNDKAVNGNTEEAIGSYDWNLKTQIPFMPWTKFSWTGYELYADKGSDVQGDIYKFEMYLTPTLQLDIGQDTNNGDDGNQKLAMLHFVYPPKDTKKSLMDGFISSEFWAKESMKSSLSDKVERNNTITVEQQGSIIITSK